MSHDANSAPKKLMKHSVMTDTDSSDDSQKLRKSWIDWFLEQPSSDWFCRLPKSFTSDAFNTSGLNIEQNHAKSALNQLLDMGSGESDSESFDSDSEDEIERCTEVIFGLLHARYIFTAEGVKEMTKKYEDGVFGCCPRFLCNGQHLLPVGMTDHPGIQTVKRYCPSCKQLYQADHNHSTLDGAYFTKSFPHFLLLELKRKKRKGVDRAISMDSNNQNTSESQSVK